MRGNRAKDGGFGFGRGGGFFLGGVIEGIREGGEGSEGRGGRGDGPSMGAPIDPFLRDIASTTAVQQQRVVYKSNLACTARESPLYNPPPPPLS